jgi:hypothetical protein
MAAGSLGCLSSPGRALARGLLDNLRAADGVADERLRRVAGVGSRRPLITSRSSSVSRPHFSLALSLNFFQWSHCRNVDYGLAACRDCDGGTMLCAPFLDFVRVNSLIWPHNAIDGMALK